MSMATDGVTSPAVPFSYADTSVKREHKPRVKVRLEVAPWVGGQVIDGYILGAGTHEIVIPQDCLPAIQALIQKEQRLIERAQEDYALELRNEVQRRVDANMGRPVDAAEVEAEFTVSWQGIYEKRHMQSPGPFVKFEVIENLAPEKPEEGDVALTMSRAIAEGIERALRKREK